MYRTKAIYQLSDLKQSSWKILPLFEIYCQSGSQAPVIQFEKKCAVLKCHTQLSNVRGMGKLKIFFKPATFAFQPEGVKMVKHF